MMPQIEQPAQGKILHPWLSVTAGDHYVSTIFVWDFHHAAMRFAIAGEPKYLRYMVDNFLDHQTSDGHTPSVVHAERGPRFLDIPYHAQPFLCQAAVMYVALTDDEAWGAHVFDRLLKYLDFYDRVYAAAYGLKRWRVGWAGGCDNDIVTALLPPDTIASCDINGWLHIEWLAAARLARQLDRKADADKLAGRAEQHRRTVNDVMWYDAMNTYSAYNLCDGKPLFHLWFDDVPSDVGRYAFQSSSNLIPLYTRMADPKQAGAMIRDYVVHPDHFWSDHGIRTLSKSSEYYNNAVFGNPTRFGDHRRMTESNWQGPVWMPVTYFTFHALRHYGFAAEAKTLADRAVATLANSLRVRGSFAENYHGETGEPLYATHYASWNLLADTRHDDLAGDSWIMNPIFE